MASHIVKYIGRVGYLRLLETAERNCALLVINKFNLICKIGYSEQNCSFKDASEASDFLDDSDEMLQAINFNTDSDILYNSMIEGFKYQNPYGIRKKIKEKILDKQRKEAYDFSIPLIIEKLFINDSVEKVRVVKENSSKKKTPTNFPFAEFVEIDVDNNSKQTGDFQDVDIPLEPEFSIKEDIAHRLRMYNEKQKEKAGHSNENKDNEELLEDSLLTELNEENEIVQSPQYGTPDPSVPPSAVPCGGCGANLHCQDETLPGYIPSELFRGKNKGELRSSLCQRCFFLETYDVALNVRISPSTYEKCLQPIRDDRALVIVIVDIIDIPCSIWPGLHDLLGSKRPIIIVGNKIDLLPPDSQLHLSTVMKSFINVIGQTSLSKTNIKHVVLTSAKTGYGIEDLITHIQVLWGTKGNIYIVGCTNSGKSTLFNVFLRSDLCKSEASDLIRRATASPWPGTTINLLKFPLLKPTGERMTRRNRRLLLERGAKMKESDPVPSRNKKQYLTTDYTQATLKGHIGRTFQHDVLPVEVDDPFRINASQQTQLHLGINDKSSKYLQSKWLFDTPGTVQSDQLLGLLTHDELVKVLPRAMIEARSFRLLAGQSLFIGGLARLDVLYVSSGKYARMTVFSSGDLPVTITNTVSASSLYRIYLGTDLLGVPKGGKSRLNRWPPLKPTNVFLVNRAPVGESCADVVLSSAAPENLCNQFTDPCIPLAGRLESSCWALGKRLVGASNLETRAGVPQTLEPSEPSIITTLKGAAKHATRRLYVHLDQLAMRNLPEIRATLPIKSQIISSIYCLCPSLCPNVDIRVLMYGFKRTELPFSTERNIVKVLVDFLINEADLASLQRRYEPFLRTRSPLVLNSGDGADCGSGSEKRSDSYRKDKIYEDVVLGGTFDRLHPGHRILVSDAVLRCKTRLTVGVADGQLLKRKILLDLIEPSDLRIEVLREFLTDVYSDLRYNLVRIDEPMGPTAWDPEMQLIVVSEETRKAVDSINDHRSGRGLNPLDSYCISLFRDSERKFEEEESKFSSSSQRMRLLGTRLKKPKPNLGIPDLPYVIGLTGGSASGKTRIAQRLAVLGAALVDCDKLGHVAYHQGTRCYSELVRVFGIKILDKNQQIDRKLLGSVVFADKNKLELLNKIVWPEIYKLCDIEIKKHKSNGKKIVIIDAAVLLEAEWDRYCHEVWLSMIDRDEAVRRIMERDGKSRDEAEMRLSSQMTNKDRLTKAHVVLSSQWSYEYTQAQVEAAWSVLQQEGIV